MGPRKRNPSAHPLFFFSSLYILFFSVLFSFYCFLFPSFHWLPLRQWLQTKNTVGSLHSALATRAIRTMSQTVNVLFSGKKKKSEKKTRMVAHSRCLACGRASCLCLYSADIISTVEFDHTGDYLATGDKGGRVVLFERNESVSYLLVRCKSRG